MIPALVIDALASYRATKLVVNDQLTAELRDAVVEAAYVSAGRAYYASTQADWSEGVDLARPGGWAELVANDPDPPKLAYLVTCPWCSGAYVAAAVVVARRLVPRLWSPVAEALALSAAAGLIAENLQHS